MKKGPLKISRKNLDLLKTHLKLTTNLSRFNQLRLKDELKNAIVLKHEELPDDVITVNSEVKFKDVDTNQEFNYKLVNPAEANMKEGKLSIYAPIGIALFGYATGAEIQWDMPTGIKTFKILSVTNYHSVPGDTAQVPGSIQLDTSL